MSKTEVYDGEINVEDLRKFFQEKNDFTTMPTWDTGELSENQAEFREFVLKYMNKSWDEVAKRKGMKYQSWNYTDDAPSELLKHRIGEIIAENVFKIAADECKLRETLAAFLPPVVESGQSADEILDNVMSLMMEVVSYPEIVDAQYKYSCDEDFRNTRKLSYAKDAHDEHYNHSEAGLKKVSMEDIKKEQLAANDELEQVISQFAVESILSAFDDRERTIIKMLLEDATQVEIATKLGVSQSCVSKLVKKIGEKMEAAFA